MKIKKYLFFPDNFLLQRNPAEYISEIRESRCSDWGGQHLNGFLPRGQEKQGLENRKIYITHNTKNRRKKSISSKSRKIERKVYHARASNTPFKLALYRVHTQTRVWGEHGMTFLGNPYVNTRYGQYALSYRLLISAYVTVATCLG